LAFLDTDRGELVVHIVFDGSPLAGKTTTVKSLAASLGANLESPEEVLGRTIFFDWLEYTGGLWNGHKIRCQVLTVPGQTSLGARRFDLLRLADCVVFVFDSSSTHCSKSFSALEELGCVLGTFPDPRPRVLLQLNKRDLPNALPRTELDTLLPKEFEDVAETAATGSSGIRDVFVRAVRLALSRVEELDQQGNLPRCRPNFMDSADLLAAVKDSERGVQGALAQTVPVEAAAWNYLQALESEENSLATMPREPSFSRRDEEITPLEPSYTVPAGAVWPPTKGRSYLKEFTELPHQLQQNLDGDWEIRFGTTWTGLSRREHLFLDFDQGRQRLLEMTRRATSAEEWLSPVRCLVLSPADSNFWRLWEVMQQTSPLQTLLQRQRKAPPEVITAALVQVFRVYYQAASEWPQERLCEALSPRIAGLHQTRLVYTSFLVAPGQSSSFLKEQEPPFEDLRSLALTYLAAQGLPLEEALRQLRALEANVPGLAKMAGTLTRILSSPHAPAPITQSPPPVESPEGEAPWWQGPS